MQQAEARLVHKETIAPAWWRLVLTWSAPVHNFSPGQFFLARCDNTFLRRPLFPQQLDTHHWSVLLRPTPDPGYAWLAARQPGNPLNLIGPLGVGFPPPNAPQRLLLISDAPGLSPLLGQMGLALAQGAAVTLAMGSQRAATLYPVAQLPAAVEVITATQDGSAGHSGPITDLLPELLPWADMVCAVGSAGLYRRLQAQSVTTRVVLTTGFLYGLLAEQGLGCGVGACYACALNTTTGPKLICTAGPVFDLAQLPAEGLNR